jgi:hypothetical protein
MAKGNNVHKAVSTLATPNSLHFRSDIFFTKTKIPNVEQKINANNEENE